jgi:2-polyprenyl-3-methyl-5-hydroxy-6-metoxy-1,4-benzoquinol methylase
MRSRRCALVLCVIGALLWPARAAAQEPDEVVWGAFLAWYKAAPATDGSPFTGYAEALGADGIPAAEAERRMKILVRLFGERTDWVEVYFDKVFSRPLTGDPATDRMSTAPAALLTSAIDGCPPGAALDAGMGQGRNAVHLARLGWRVTGFDVSAGAIAAAQANARKAGVQINAVKASYDEFPLGESQWDLVVLAFAWAPVTDPAFVARLRRSLRPGGLVVFEHFLDDPARPRPAIIYAMKPGQLRTLFDGFTIVRYEEVDDVGDWGGPGSRLVRMIASKR